MGGTIFSRLRLGAGKLLCDQRGNALMLTAAAILPVLGLVGSGIDIGRAYMTQLRLQQACDAGVLAGRRAMTGGSYSAEAEAEADKMFNFNFPTDIYGSSQIAFSSEAQGASSVAGTASAYLPTAVMQIFNYDGFNLAVNCTAKLEISNTDVMMVLDVTGSMAQTNSGDSVNRITALRAATKDFFETLTTAEMGDGRLRFGVVPYSSAANVGAIIAAKDPDWLSDTVTLPSRTPMFRVTWGDGTTEYSPDYVDEIIDQSNFSTIDTVSSPSETSCEAMTPPVDSTPDPDGSPDSNQTAQYVDGDGNRITTYDTEQDYEYYNYRYWWNDNRNKCRLQRRQITFRRTQTTTVTEVPVQEFDDKYVYQDRVFDVSQAKTGAALVTDVGDAGVSQTDYWGGCVMERATVPFGPAEAAPSDAYDMDVDSPPTSDDFTKWKLLIPEIAFARAQKPGWTPSTTGSITVASDNVTPNTSSNGNWQNYSRYWGSGWGVCPAAAMNLTTMTASDQSSFNSYIDSLQPVGGTYHDAGMVWGVRFLSPDGLFAAENATAPNGRPIGRHIVFMTDGEMAPNFGNLTFQGYEPTMGRVGSTSNSGLEDRHNNRFLQLCEKAKAKNITVWVIGFGVTLNSQLNACATPGNAYQADNAAQLNEKFQAIARQISKLRLSQ